MQKVFYGGMRNTLDTFADLIDEWGIAQLAEDIGLKYPSANAMKQRNSIPSRYWPVLLEKGRVPLSQAALYQIQARSETARKAKRQSEAA